MPLSLYMNRWYPNADVDVYASTKLLKTKKEKEEYEKTKEELMCKNFLRLRSMTSNPRVGTWAECAKRKLEHCYELRRKKYKIASKRSYPRSGGSKKLVGKREVENDRIDNRIGKPWKIPHLHLSEVWRKREKWEERRR